MRRNPQSPNSKLHTTVQSFSRRRVSSSNFFQAFIVATSTSHSSSACTEEMNSVSGGGRCPRVYACVERRTQAQYGPPGDGGRGSSGCSAPSHPGRPRPVSPQGTHCWGPRTSSSCPTKVNLGDLGEPEVPPCDPQILSGKRKWPSVASWGRPEVTRAVGHGAQ